jgi:hypothetical protein
MDHRDYAKYTADAPPSMSRFQIEQFVLGTEPPTDRYFICCTQIKSRLGDLRGLKAKLEEKDLSDLSRETITGLVESVERELEIFKELADTWYPMTRGLKYEELQRQIWDERLCHRICLNIAAGNNVASCVSEVMAMPPGSTCRRMITCLTSEDPEGELEKIMRSVMELYSHSAPAVGHDEQNKLT